MKEDGNPSPLQKKRQAYCFNVIIDLSMEHKDGALPSASINMNYQII